MHDMEYPMHCDPLIPLYTVHDRTEVPRSGTAYTCEVYDPEGAPVVKQGITVPPEFSPLAWHRDRHPDGAEDMAQENATEVWDTEEHRAQEGAPEQGIIAPPEISPLA